MRKGQTHPSTFLSKNMLGQGLVQLLEERAFSEITVTELCDRSQIARRTFYRHFATLEDVLSYYVQELMAGFVEAMRSANPSQSTSLELAETIGEASGFEKLVLAYFSYWKQHSSLLIQLNKNQLLALIFTQYIQSLHRHPEILLSHISQHPAESYYEPKLAYVSGGLWSLLIYWVSTECKHSSQELAQMIASI